MILKVYITFITDHRTIDVMEFIKSSNSVNGTEVCANRLIRELSDGKKVLWLVCGGSAISAEAEILKAIHSSGTTERLTVMLMDERYGAVGHPDSNWWQLQQAGCDFTSINALPVMADPLKSLTETATEYAQKVARAFDEADVVIGLFGLGADGHTAGILPNSPAATEESKLVVGYNSPPFDRITLTRKALLRVDVAFVFAFGDSKSPALLDLQRGEKPFIEMPARLHAELPECYVYNDQIGDTI